MSAAATHTPPAPAEAAPKRLGLFERYLTIWVGLCMVVDVLAGRQVCW